MSLFYKCDCCGQEMHMVGDNNGKRLHLDIGELMDDARDSNGKRTSWNIERYPLIGLDMCWTCYSTVKHAIGVLRQDHGLDPDLEEVSIGGKSV